MCQLSREYFSHSEADHRGECCTGRCRSEEDTALLHWTRESQQNVSSFLASKVVSSWRAEQYKTSADWDIKDKMRRRAYECRRRTAQSTCQTRTRARPRSSALGAASESRVAAATQDRQRYTQINIRNWYKVMLSISKIKSCT